MLSQEVYPSAWILPAGKDNSSFFRKTSAPFILLDFLQTPTSLMQAPCLLPSIPTLTTCSRLPSGQSAKAEWTWTVHKQQMQNSQVCLHILRNAAIRVHGACLQDANFMFWNVVCSSSMPGTSWKLCACSWIMLHPRTCFLPQKNKKRGCK